MQLQRLFRFRLRTLLLVMVVSSMASGLFIRYRNMFVREEAARKLIADAAANIKSEPAKPNWLGTLVGEERHRHVVELTSFGADARDPLTNEQMQHVAAFTRLRKLDVSGDITDDGMAAIAELAYLEELTLSSNSGVTGESMAAMSGMRRLRELNLRGHCLKGDCLEAFRHCHSLERIVGSGILITNEHVEPIVGLANLREFDFSVGLYAGPLAEFSNFPKLESLILQCDPLVPMTLSDCAELHTLTLTFPPDEAKFEDGAWEVYQRNPVSLTLASLPKLKTLTLDGVKRGDLSFDDLPQLETVICLNARAPCKIKQLRGLPNLRVLRIPGAKWNDDHLRELAKSPHLRELDLSFSDVTDEGVDHLKANTELEELLLKGTKTTAVDVTPLYRAE